MAVWVRVRLPILRETAGPLGYSCRCGRVHARGAHPHTDRELRRILRRRTRGISPVWATVLLVLVTVVVAGALYIVITRFLR